MNDWTRRDFIGAFGVTGMLLPLQLSHAKGSGSPPEISASVFPWDLADEGLEQVLDNLQEMAGTNSVYMCNLSQSTRPFRSTLR